MIRKTKSPYLKDIHLAYLTVNARRTDPDEFPIIEKWMVSTRPPNKIVQWDRRRDAINPGEVAVSFYCTDLGFQPILKNPKAYIKKLAMFDMVIGMDASPYDNMPLVVQKSQIYLNLAVSYYFGMQGLQIIPNVRLGNPGTLSSLKAYPKGTLIALGTNGFVRQKLNRSIYANQIRIVTDTLEPSGICVYGPAPDELFGYPKNKGIPIYQYDSYAMSENSKKRNQKQEAQ